MLLLSSIYASQKKLINGLAMPFLPFSRVLRGFALFEKALHLAKPSVEGIAEKRFDGRAIATSDLKCKHSLSLVMLLLFPHKAYFVNRQTLRICLRLRAWQPLSHRSKYQQ